MRFFEHSKATAFYLKLAGTIHLSFSDFSLLLELDALNQFGGDATHVATMDGIQVHEVSRAILLSFFRRYLNGTLLPGAAAASYEVPAVTMDSAGCYTVRVTDANGTTTCTALIEVVPLRFNSEPQDVKAALGGTATFQVSVQSPDPVTYQWQHLGLVIVGATADTLVLTNLQAEAMGTYSVHFNSVPGQASQRHLRVGGPAV